MDFLLRDRDRVGPLLKAIMARMAEPGIAGAAEGTFLAMRWDQEAGAFAEGDVWIGSQVTKDTRPPFVTVANAEPKPWGSKTKPGNEIMLNLVVVSQFQGMDEVNYITGKLLDALTGRPLDLVSDGLDLILWRCISQPAGVLGEDGRTQFRRMTFRAIVVDTATQSPA